MQYSAMQKMEQSKMKHSIYARIIFPFEVTDCFGLSTRSCLCLMDGMDMYSTIHDQTKSNPAI